LNVLLVGSSGELKERKIGKQIDKFDVVCRINSGGRPECLTGEYKDIIGEKTNLWLCSHIGLFNFFSTSMYDKAISFNEEYYNDNKERLINLEFCGDQVLIDCKETLLNFNNNKGVPTSGILSIFYLLSKYKDVTICGFDGFTKGHWYGNKFIGNQDKSDIIASKGLGRHNALKEYEYIKHLIKTNKIKKL
tara:strand:- start:271 stop:843 length:573 start_codon:yes stop_codon:yes gene_type:complete